MNRREAISAVSLLLGGTLVGADLLVACSPKASTGKMLFDRESVAILDEIGDTILPATDTPGAKATMIGNFMALMVQDCYPHNEQEVFLKGIGHVNEASRKRYGEDFMNINASQRTDLLVDLDKEQQVYMKNKKKEDPSHYFRMMKELSLLGYFTSEIGSTQALRYVAIPGRFDGCIPYKKGDKAWAT